ncbi:hypothetical protein ACHAWF_011372 [Thalassiosira exigua]
MYRVIPPIMVCVKEVQIQYELGSFLSEVNKMSPDSKKTFFRAVKVHKTPWKTKLIVDICGTFIHGLSCWVDVHLQRLKDFSPIYLRDSYQMLEQLDKLDEFPNGTMLFTMDVTAIYNNINIDHGLEVLEKFIEMFKGKLCDNFPKAVVLWTMKIVVR